MPPQCWNSGIKEHIRLSLQECSKVCLRVVSAEEQHKSEKISWTKMKSKSMLKLYSAGNVMWYISYYKDGL